MRPRSEHFILVASGFVGDPEFRRLARLAGTDERTFTAIGVWLVALAAARRAKDRTAVDLDGAPEWVEGVLRGSGLLDDGGIPGGQFEKWAAVRSYPSDLDRKHRHSPVSTDLSTVQPGTTQDSATLHNTPQTTGASGQVRSNVVVASPSNGISVVTTPRARARGSVTLSKAQLDAWASFGPEWGAFKAAWLDRGFLWPPAGNAEDDDTSQRGLLWSILDARPGELVALVRAAPGKTAREVVAHVLKRWRQVKAEAEVDPDPPVRPPRRGAMVPLGEALAAATQSAVD